MCGISGLVAPADFQVATRRKILNLINQAMANRGPDDEGVWMGERVGFGHRRLSVIDIDGGHQPMESLRGYVLTFNGEIYNYREIRRDLEEKGFSFSTNSDAEVLLRAYEVFGKDCLGKLIGMFAFAIYDPERNALFMARDRFGKKPIHYFHDKEFFVFASDINALLAADIVREKAEINPLALSDFLSLGYVLAPKTIYNNICQLPGAHAAYLALDSMHLRIWPYWSLENFVTDDPVTYDQRARDRFGEILHDAVSLRLRSDVGVVAHLSGGVDSAAVMAVATQAGGGETEAITVRFDEMSFDESLEARETATALGAKQQIVDAGLLPQDHLYKIVDAIGAPLADTSLLPTWVLNEQTRSRSKVALSGDGADEWLAGYVTHRANQLNYIYRLAPNFVRGLLSSAARRFIPPTYRKVGWDYKVRQFLSASCRNRERAHYHWRTIFSEIEKEALMTDALASACRGYDPYETFEHYFSQVRQGTFVDQCIYVDIKTWLHDDVLVKADRMSMAHGVEIRSPFLDHRLVEFVLPLEKKAKLDWRRSKAILRDFLKKTNSGVDLDRPKQGFGSPTQTVGIFSITDNRARDYLNADYKLYPDRDDVTYKSFAFAVLDEWFRRSAIT